MKRSLWFGKTNVKITFHRLEEQVQFGTSKDLGFKEIYFAFFVPFQTTVKRVQIRLNTVTSHTHDEFVK
jgi:hypothetical protein